MKTPCLLRRGWPALLCPLLLLSEKGATPPVAIRQVEPVYEAGLEKSYFLEPASVKVVIDSEGGPFSLESSMSLPDNVVQALSQWRFRPGKLDGRDTAFAVEITVPLRRPMDLDAERRLRRPAWRPAAKELVEALKAGGELDADGAARLEQRLATDPQNTDTRATLLAYYAKVPSPANRARHIAWLTDNQPTADILSSPLARIDATEDAEGFKQVRELWLKQLALDSGNPKLVAPASNFLRISDPEKIEQLLVPAARKLVNAAVWVGDLYALAALGSTSLDFKTGLPISGPDRLPDSVFARKARATLTSTDDARVVFSALATVTAGGRSLKTSGHLPAGYAPFCDELLNRARQIYPATSASCDTSATVPDPSATVPREGGAPNRIRVGGNVQVANLIKKVTPPYPPEAKSRRIQGTVKFNVVIGKDGSIQSLELIGGPLALYKEARAAVLRWEYRPTLLNGQPVEVITMIDVNFTLSR